MGPKSSTRITVKPFVAPPATASPNSVPFVRDSRLLCIVKEYAGLIVGSILGIPAIVILCYFIYLKRLKRYTETLDVDCYLCGKQVSAFRAHMKIHLKEERQQLVKMLEETKIVSCHYCDSKYSTLTGYLYHKDRCRFAPHPPLAPLLKKSNKRKEECEV